MTGARSALGEVVSFKSAMGPGSIDPNAVAPSSESAVWGVETWLGLVNTAMQAGTGRAIDECLAAYRRTPHPPRVAWALESGPGQAALVAAQVLWTANTETALAAGPEALAKALRRHTAGLEDVLAALRHGVAAAGGPALSPAARVTLSNLAMLDVHGRDVLSALTGRGTPAAGGAAPPAVPVAASDFAWQSQLRYYWSPRSQSARLDMPGTLVLETLRSRVAYGNEFIGSTIRLVTTPLVERCQRALLSAVAHGAGGAVSGPSGAGKTALVRDVAHAAGAFSVTIACGPDTSHPALTQVC